MRRRLRPALLAATTLISLPVQAQEGFASRQMRQGLDLCLSMFTTGAEFEALGRRATEQGFQAASDPDERVATFEFRDPMDGVSISFTKAGTLSTCTVRPTNPVVMADGYRVRRVAREWMAANAFQRASNASEGPFGRRVVNGQNVDLALRSLLGETWLSLANEP